MVLAHHASLLGQGYMYDVFHSMLYLCSSSRKKVASQSITEGERCFYSTKSFWDSS